METNIQERNWHLVRNDNGEWISERECCLSYEAGSKVAPDQGQIIR